MKLFALVSQEQERVGDLARLRRGLGVGPRRSLVSANRLYITDPAAIAAIASKAGSPTLDNLC